MAEPETAGGLLPSARCVKGIVTATVSDTLAVVLPPSSGLGPVVRPTSPNWDGQPLTVVDGWTLSTINEACIPYLGTGLSSTYGQRGNYGLGARFVLVTHG